ISIYAAGMALVCDLADAIANSVKETDGEILLVASSDMSHRISEDKAKKLDMLASEHILSLNWEEFLKTVSSMNISICGAIPIAVVMAAALRLGATSVEMTDYTSSAAVTGDKDDVVGYAGFLIK
ncbi:MAG: AmmeMemoRadiSam system protein B, partial [Elusimicrobia bacterium]|nr:AmmeMemoRadiSam system protein B [Elusimicrobiota bacterium]